MNQEEYLRFQLDFHRWTPEDLAKFAKVKRKVVEEMLRGRKTPDQDSQNRVSRCLGVNAEVWHHL